MNVDHRRGWVTSWVSNVGPTRRFSRLSLLFLVVAIAALFCFLAVAQADTGGLATVYLNGATGSDTNDGSTSVSAVKTFQKAKELLQPTDGTIEVTGLITVTSPETWDLTGYTNTKVMRDSSYAGILISVSTGGNLTLSNIVVDGNKSSVANAGSLVQVDPGTLTMSTGAELRNNSSLTLPGGVYMPQNGSGTFIMNDGRITGNSGTSATKYYQGGGVGVSGGTFTMNGGSIDANTAAYGGGVAARGVTTRLLGGTISGNSASSLGAGLYAASATGQPTIGSNMTISDGIYIDGQLNYINISGAVKNTLNVTFGAAGVTPFPVAENRAVQGSSYTLTVSDLKRFVVGNSTWYFKLNTGTNQLLWTNTAPSWVTGVGLDKVSDSILVGQTSQRTATVSPVGATYPTVSWHSDNTGVATVDASGLVTAVAAGTANITATTDDGGYAATCAVTVPADISTATVDGIPTQVAYTGSPITFTPTVTLGAATLTATADYTVGYAHNTSLGTASVTITGTGAYTGSITKNFSIVKAIPSITSAPTASDIQLGNALSASTLTGGAATTTGTFAFTNPSTVPDRTGVYSTGITFTPSDTANYGTASGTVNATVVMPAAGLATVYLNGAIGSDANDGWNAANAVKTFARAKAILNKNGGTIDVTGLVTITSTEAWDLSGYTNAVVSRDASYAGGAIVTVTTGGDLSLSNIVIDGNKAQVADALAPLVEVDAGVLTIGAGTALRNNSSSVSPGGVFVPSTSTGAVTMNGGRITGNSGTSVDDYTLGGGVGVFAGTFTMNGGSIDANTASKGGGVGERTAISLLGGTITNNSASSGGNDLYASSRTGFATIGPNMTIGGEINVNGQYNYLKISGAIKSNLTVTCTGGSLVLAEDHLAAVSSGAYEITVADLRKFVAGNAGWYFKLSGNQILFTATKPVYATGVSLNKASAAITVGQTTQLAATLAPSGVTYAGVTWRSDNTSVATVNAAGLVTATGAGVAHIFVTTDDGGYSASCSVSVSAGPLVTSLSPARALTTGGQTITVAGTNLSGATAVKFGGVSARSFMVNSSTKITAVAPAHAAGKVDVTVVTPGGTTAILGTADDLYYLARSEQTDYRMLFGGTWRTLASSSLSGGSYKYSSTTGAYVIIPFSGTRLDLVGTKGPNMGKTSISLDGKTAVIYDLYRATSANAQVIYSTGALTSGQHWVKVSYTGTKNTSSKGYSVNVDAVDVAGSLSSSTRFEQTDTHIVYSSGWASLPRAGASGGSYWYANSSGASATVNFNGTSIAVIATKASSFGKVKITLDGGTPRSLDLYSSVTLYRQTVYSSGLLAPGTHTLKIERSGQRNTSSSGYSVSLDALDVRGSLK